MIRNLLYLYDIDNFYFIKKIAKNVCFNFLTNAGLDEIEVAYEKIQDLEKLKDFLEKTLAHIYLLELHKKNDEPLKEVKERDEHGYKIIKAEADDVVPYKMKENEDLMFDFAKESVREVFENAYVWYAKLNKNACFEIPNGKYDGELIPYSEIQYVTTATNSCSPDEYMKSNSIIIRTPYKEYDFVGTIKDLINSKKLPSTFRQCHSAYIIPVNRIAGPFKKTNPAVTLKDITGNAYKVPMSRAYRNEIADSYKKYTEEQGNEYG